MIRYDSGNHSRKRESGLKLFREDNGIASIFDEFNTNIGEFVTLGQILNENNRLNFETNYFFVCIL
jgi:hypothetical protein